MTALLKKLHVRVVIRRYEVILIGSVLLLSGAVMPSSWEPPFKSYRVPAVDLVPPHPWIALTFDDGLSEVRPLTDTRPASINCWR